MIRALIPQSRGLAVFDDEQGPGLLDGQSSRPVTRDERTIARMLHGARDIEPIEVADLEALSRHLQLRRDREILLHATLVLIDGTRPEGLRALAAKTWREICDEEVWLWVQGVLLSTPAPEGADFEGGAVRLGDRGSALTEIGELQPAVSAVDRAWRSVPQEFFEGRSRDDARADAVRAGHFGALVRRIGVRNEDDTERHVQLWCDVLRTTAEARRARPAPRETSAREPWGASLHHWLDNWLDRVSSVAGRRADTVKGPAEGPAEPAPVLAWALERAAPAWHAIGSPHECRALRPRYRHTLEVMSLAQADRVQLRRLVRLLLQASAERPRETSRNWHDCLYDEDLAPNLICLAGHGAFEHSVPRLESASDDDPIDLARVVRLLDIGESQRVSATVLLSACQSGVLDRRGCYAEMLGGFRGTILRNPLEQLRCELVGRHSDIFRRLHHRLEADWSSALPRQRAGWLSFEELAHDAGRTKSEVTASVQECQARIEEAGFSRDLLEEEGGRRVRLGPDYIVPTAA